MSRQERGTSPRATPTGTLGKFEDCAPLRRHSRASGNPSWLSPAYPRRRGTSPRATGRCPVRHSRASGNWCWHLHFPVGGGQAPALRGEAVFQSVIPAQAGTRVGSNPSFQSAAQAGTGLGLSHLHFPGGGGQAPALRGEAVGPIRHSQSGGTSASGNPCWLSHLHFPGQAGDKPPRYRKWEKQFSNPSFCCKYPSTTSRKASSRSSMLPRQRRAHALSSAIFGS